MAVAIAALALAGGGAAIAATKILSPQEQSQAIITDAAGQLGVSPSELSAALKKALKDQIDAAVAAGRLTKEQGDELEARVDAGGFPFFFGELGLGGPGPGFFHLVPFGGGLDAAASYLGLSESELRSQLASGKTLAEIAKSQDKSVDGLVDALVTNAGKKIDQAVADGRLTKAQGDQIKAGLKSRITDVVNGGQAFHDHFRFRKPAGGFHGPPFRFRAPSWRTFRAGAQA